MFEEFKDYRANMVPGRCRLACYEPLHFESTLFANPTAFTVQHIISFHNKPSFDQLSYFPL